MHCLSPAWQTASALTVTVTSLVSLFVALLRSCARTVHVVLVSVPLTPPLIGMSTTVWSFALSVTVCVVPVWSAVSLHVALMVKLACASPVFWTVARMCPTLASLNAEEVTLTIFGMPTGR